MQVKETFQRGKKVTLLSHNAEQSTQTMSWESVLDGESWESQEWRMGMGPNPIQFEGIG